jgi:hypothetical protein
MLVKPLCLRLKNLIVLGVAQRPLRSADGGSNWDRLWGLFEFGTAELAAPVLAFEGEPIAQMEFTFVLNSPFLFS